MVLNDDEIQIMVQKGIRLLEEAEEFEMAKNYASAIFKYQKGAEILSKCKLPREKIDAIYDRIAYLNNLNEQEKEEMAKTPPVDPEELQNQAFQSIDDAKMMENQNKFPEAAEAYMRAVQLLMQAGWDESQLTGFQLELKRIRQKAQAAMSVDESSQIQPSRTTSSGQQGSQPQQVMASDMGGYNEVNESSNSQPAHQASMQYPASAGQQGMKSGATSSGLKYDDLQDKAFECIDTARDLESTDSLNDAVEKYREAISYLKRAGWGSKQLERFQEKISALSKQIASVNSTEGGQSFSTTKKFPSHSSQSSKANSKTVGDYKASNHSGGTTLADLEEKRRKNFRIMQAKKQQMEKKQQEAFELLDKAKELEKRKQWDNAIEVCSQAAAILKDIGWTRETESIHDTIRRLKKEKQKAIEDKKQQESKVAKATETESREPASELGTESIFKMKEFEKKKLEKEQKQQDAFKILDEGEKLASTHQYDDAIEKYNDAIDALNSLGWTEYIPRVKETIRSLQDEKKKHDAKITRTFKSTEEKKTAVSSVGTEKSPQDVYLLKTKRIAEFEQKQEEEEKLENRAFSLLEEGEKAIQKAQYDTAIQRYRQAINLLQDLGWTEQIVKLKEVVKSIISEKDRAERAAQQQEVKRLEREQQSQKRASKITQVVQEKRRSRADREKLDKLKEYQEQRRKNSQLENEALALIEEGIALSKGLDPDYDSALELLNKAKTMLQEAGWTQQINTINSMIESLNNEKARKQQERLLKEKQRKKAIEEHRKFKDVLAIQKKEMDQKKKEQYERLQKYQENKKKTDEIQLKAFNLMDQAKEQAQAHNYDGAINSYKSAIAEFTKIGWSDQISVVNEEIIRTNKLKEDFETEKSMLEDMKNQEMNKRKKMQEEAEKRKAQEMDDLKNISDMIRTVSSGSAVVPPKNAEDEVPKEPTESPVSILKDEIKKKSEERSVSGALNSQKEKEREEKADELKMFKEMIRKAADKNDKND